MRNDRANDRTKDITLRFGNIEIAARLNDTETAQAFARHLPMTVHVNRTGVDFCGRMPFSLPYDQAQVHRGWTNGDVNYNPGGGWFAVLYDGEDESDGYGDQVILGHIGESDIEKLHGLSRSYDLAVERAERENE